MHPPVERSACAKVILFGEHAVVYGRPAIALPISGLRTTVRVESRSGVFEIRATDINHIVHLPQVPPTQLRRPHPLALIAYLTLKHINVRAPRALVTISSRIPVGSNLGSGAAVSIAIALGIAAYLGSALSAEDASALAYEVERLHHGTPSGVDNTVIAHELPVWFVKNEPSVLLGDARPLPLVIADSGKSTPTRIPVGDVRAAWEAEPDRLNSVFDAIGQIVTDGRAALLMHDLHALGALMDKNHTVLQALGVSSPELDQLCISARVAGALGAKMSGGGRGGNMIALARDEVHASAVRAALLNAGARRVFINAPA